MPIIFFTFIITIIWPDFYSPIMDGNLRGKKLFNVKWPFFFRILIRFIVIIAVIKSGFFNSVKVVGKNLLISQLIPIWVCFPSLLTFHFNSTITCWALTTSSCWNIWKIKESMLLVTNHSNLLQLDIYSSTLDICLCYNLQLWIPWRLSTIND